MPAGAAGNWCIRATAYAALVEDAHTTGALELDDGTVVPAESIVRELHAPVAWPESPGRRNGTAPVARLDFFRPGQKA